MFIDWSLVFKSEFILFLSEKYTERVDHYIKLSWNHVHDNINMRRPIVWHENTDVGTFRKEEYDFIRLLTLVHNYFYRKAM